MLSLYQKFYKMKNIFTEHPKQVGETYFQHLIKAFSFSFKLLWMSVQAMIHALFPFLCVSTVSVKIKGMNDSLQSRKDAIKKN